MTEENDLMSIIIEEINATIRPLDLVVTYILWKDGGEVAEEILLKELDSFIESIKSKVLEGMIDKCVDLGLLKQDEKGNITKMSENDKDASIRSCY